MSYGQREFTTKQNIASALGWIIILSIAWFSRSYWLPSFITNDSKPTSSDSNERHDDLLRRSQSNDRTNWVPGSVGR
ncbi:MAG: hypothetical protein WC477_02670 [Patescibacteria group bacterium]